MRKIAILSTVLLALAGCKDFMDGTQRVGYNIRKEVVKTSNRISDYFRVEENKPKPKRQVMTPRYCYKAMADIVCYHDPQQGAENRLVGYYEPPAEEEIATLPANGSGGFVVPAAQQVHVKPLLPPPASGSGSGTAGAKSAVMEQTPKPLISR